MSVTSIIICGAFGRMGKAITAAAGADREIAVRGLVEAQGHPDLGSVVRVGDGDIAVTADIPRCQNAVMVDFTSPEATMEHLREAVIRGHAIVVGTTGLGDAHRREAEHAARKIPVIVSANMSAGVSLLLRLAGEAARILGAEADVEIIETHHNRKKDAPSGTALMIASAVADARGRPHGQDLVFGRAAAPGPGPGPRERKPGEIGIHAVRGGDIAGDHTVLFALAGERLELTHRAHGRDALARGTLRAAKFAAAAEPGLYSMKDVLGLGQGLEKAG